LSGTSRRASRSYAVGKSLISAMENALARMHLLAGLRKIAGARNVGSRAALILYVGLAGTAQAQDAPEPKAGPALQKAIPLPGAFGQETVVDMARSLATQAYRPPATVDFPWLPKSYDDYKRLKLRRESALWATDPPHFEIHPLLAGWLFEHPVEISVVENGIATPVSLQSSDFLDHRDPKPEALKPPQVPLSGFRINGPLNAPGIADEIIAMQGATYFRALAEGQVYGLSARGVAIGTASPAGEEFPKFRRFWIEKPDSTAGSIQLYALLDSPSTTGAYKFVLTPGTETRVDVSATLFPRSVIKTLGLAPLTSMFLVGPSDATRVEDFRPRVHDSDGLAILSGTGERIWRPLSNPRSLQVSTFAGTAPRGFGLIQRHRQFEGYQDLEARYERRPSLWVEPVSGFENGNVVLVEIPTDEEIHDNIVAFFRPQSATKAQEPTSFSYRLRWRDDAPTRSAGPWVASTRVGRIGGRQAIAYSFVVDYRDEPNAGTKLPVGEVRTSAGKIEGLTIQANPETRGFRVTFVLDPEAADLSELRLTLGPWEGRTPETWLYRWTKRK
jgi:periplasmic glucans biosynthesis protein